MDHHVPLDGEAKMGNIDEEVPRANQRNFIGELRKGHSKIASKIGPFKVVKYTDFVQFGSIPRISDGLAKRLDSRDGDAGKGGDELVIFFSDRTIDDHWSIKYPLDYYPDDRNRTLYKRMIDAVDQYLTWPGTQVTRDDVYIWVDHACINQGDRDRTTRIPGTSFFMDLCNLVITFQDQTHPNRLESIMAQVLQARCGNVWFEHVPEPTQDTATTTSTIKIQVEHDTDDGQIPDKDGDPVGTSYITIWPGSPAQRKWRLQKGADNFYA